MMEKTKVTYETTEAQTKKRGNLFGKVSSKTTRGSGVGAQTGFIRAKLL